MKPFERLMSVLDYLEEEDIPLGAEMYVPIVVAGVLTGLQEDGLDIIERGGELILTYDLLEGLDALVAFFEQDEDTIIELFGTPDNPTTVEHVISELQA